MKPGKDRLSEMPDEILVHILSYLPTAEAVRTMLIRPFGNLWTLIPSLEFEYNQVLLTLIPDGTCSWDDVRRFFTFIRNYFSKDPSEITNLSFSAPNIRKLFLCFEKDDPDTDPWVFDFPKLKSLDLCLYGIPNVYHINFSSVRYVKLEVFSFEVDDENILRMFKLFLEKLSQSEVFCLSDASEIFLHLLEDLHLLQIRWKRVVLPLGIFCQSCLLGVYRLMRSSKDLEELDIYTNTTSACRASVDLPPVELSDPCVMPKLKTVTLYGFEKPWKHQLQLVEFLLKSATALEKLVIVPNEGQFSITEKQDFVMHVSSFQRSSPSARVLFL